MVDYLSLLVLLHYLCIDYLCLMINGSFVFDTNPFFLLLIALCSFLTGNYPVSLLIHTYSILMLFGSQSIHVNSCLFCLMIANSCSLDLSVLIHCLMVANPWYIRVCHANP